MGVAEANQVELNGERFWVASRRRLGRIDAGVVAIEGAVASGLTVLIVATVLVQVIMRYVFAHPNAWTEELSRYAFVWLSLLGASLATKRGAHFLFDSAVNRLPTTMRRLVDLAVALLLGAMLVGAIIVGTELAAAVRFQRSPALEIPLVWVYAALPVAATLMLLHLVAGRHGAIEGEPGWASH